MIIDEKNSNDWNKVFDKKGIKSNLIRASFYLFSYELLRNAVVDKLKDFFCTGFTGDKVIISPKYNELIVHRKINGKQNIFLSSLLWLQENQVITEEESAEIIQIKEFRNIVAHQIDKILLDSDINIDDKIEKRMFELSRKIEVWWIREVEITINLDGKEVTDEDIIPGTQIFYSYIKSITEELIEDKK